MALYYNSKVKILANGEIIRTNYSMPRSIRTDITEKIPRNKIYRAKYRRNDVEKNINSIIETIDILKKERKMEQVVSLQRVLYEYINQNEGKCSDLFLTDDEFVENIVIKRYKNWLLNSKRASNKLIDLAKCNINEENYKDMVFTTLTFSAPMQDIRKANDEFGNFIKRLNYYFRKKISGFSLKYIAVPELHLHGEMAKKGIYSWHFHYIAFNQPWIPSEVFTDIWNKGGKGVGGFTNIRCIISKNRRGKDTYNDLEHAINYVCKYIRKNVGDVAEIGEDIKEQYYSDKNYTLYELLGLVGKKKFFTSRNLNKPKEFYLKEKDTYILEKHTELNYSKTKEIELNVQGVDNKSINKVVDLVNFEKRRVKNKASIPLLANHLENAQNRRLTNINKLYSKYNIKYSKSKLKAISNKYHIPTNICYEEFTKILRHRRYLERKNKIECSLKNCNESI